VIPRIIHQTWKSARLPPKFARYQETWTRLNPDCDYRFYDDAACAELVHREFPDLVDLYDSLPLPILKADLFRYLVVFRYGGLYADLDMECLKPFGLFFGVEGAVVSIEARVTAKRQWELGYRHPYQIANCIFASGPGHPFFGAVIEAACEAIRARKNITVAEVEDVTGPRMLTRTFYAASANRPHVLPQSYWLPYRLYPQIFPLTLKMYARHHFAGSWKAGTQIGPLKRRWIERDVPPNPFPAKFHSFGAQ